MSNIKLLRPAEAQPMPNYFGKFVSYLRRDPLLNDKGETHNFKHSRPLIPQETQLPTVSQLPNKFHGHFATPLEYVISLIR